MATQRADNRALNLKFLLTLCWLTNNFSRLPSPSIYFTFSVCQSFCIINVALLMLKHTVNLTIYFSRHFLLVAVAFLIEFFFSFALILFVFSPVGKIPYILNTHAYTTRHVKAQGAKKKRTTSRTFILFSLYSVHWDVVECKSIKTEHFNNNMIRKKKWKQEHG